MQKRKKSLMPDEPDKCTNRIDNIFKYPVDTYNPPHHPPYYPPPILPNYPNDLNNVPEPGTLTLILSGLAGIALARRASWKKDEK